MASNTPSRLDKARAELHGKNTVCFLGDVKSGKTVSSSLLKHAAVNHFVPGRPGEYQAIVSQGMDVVNRSLGDMILHGQFPPSTLPVSDPQVVLDIYKMSGVGAGKFEIILRDSSGEHFFKYMLRECQDSSDRLHEVLDYSSGPDEVGPLAHYIFAKLYIITVDCSDVAALEHKQSLLTNAVATLHKLHSAASLTQKDKIATPIAILFTKADLLNEHDSSQSATSLLDRMPELKSALNLRHGGDLECFMVSVSTCAESRDDQDKRVEQKKEIFDRERAEAAGQRGAAEAEISAKCDRERKKVSNLKGAELEAHMSKYEEKLRGGLVPVPSPEDFDEERVRKEQTHRPVLPLAYTHGEYVRLIVWIISQLVG